MDNRKHKHCFWRHDWTKWERKVSEHAVIDDKDYKGVVYQERRCLNCGLYERKLLIFEH
jgi:hypothetical protein